MLTRRWLILYERVKRDWSFVEFWKGCWYFINVLFKSPFVNKHHISRLLLSFFITTFLYFCISGKTLVDPMTPSLTSFNSSPPFPNPYFVVERHILNQSMIWPLISDTKSLQTEVWLRITNWKSAQCNVLHTVAPFADTYAKAILR